ncbi:MAG: metallophosphoesterase family protein [Terriglobales bacterium]
MKILIVSDLHGNADALTALRERADETWVLGDLVNYGPQPNEVVEWVARNATHVVRGNHDQALGYDQDPRCSPPFRNMAAEMGRYTASVLTAENRRYLRRLPRQLTLERDGVRFYLCHAVPSDPLYGYCSAESERWAAELAATEAEVLLVGHTHTPFVRVIGGHRVVNPGSLGQPKTGGPEACYAVWENGAVALRRLAYPWDETASKLRAAPVGAEVREDLIAVLRTGRPAAREAGHGA